MRYVKWALAACVTLVAGEVVASGPAPNWLAGRWCGCDEGRRIEEVWLAEAGGMLLGMSRTLRDARVESFEFMRIVAEGNNYSLHVQPNGVPATVFRMVARDDASMRFENPAHDFPNRIEYRRTGDELHAAIAGPGRDGKTMTIPFAYRRCGD